MLNTIKNSKLIFITIFFFNFLNIFSYEIQESRESLDGDTDAKNWNVIQYYLGEITIIRSSNETSGSADITFTRNFLKVSNSFDGIEEVSETIATQYSITTTNGITATFTSPSSSGDKSLITQLNTANNTLNFQAMTPNNSGDIFDILATLNISIPLSLEDGTFELTYKLNGAAEGDFIMLSKGLNINIVTTPVVQVDDIDFGRQIKGVGTVTRTSNITVTGKEGAELSYTLDTSGKFVQAGGGSTISFTSEIITNESSKIVDGKSTATLQVTTDISDDVDPGKYTGSIRVLVQHN